MLKMPKLAINVLAVRLIKVFAIRQYRFYGQGINSLKLRLRSIIGNKIDRSKEDNRKQTRKWRAGNPEKVNKGSVRNHEKDLEYRRKWYEDHRLEFNLYCLIWKRKKVTDPEYRARLTKYNREYSQWVRAVKKAQEAQNDIQNATD